ncbi:hypothetical protein Syn7502_02150 [Synechococcus sp. PCC 7502]|uniref:DUF1800 domain-containing protein n=1 Tax=Synechococcus sp. PCC 7502 TaxID=1173263 RepID=UPI0002A0005A|nr:DUF1800 domain-containing protein [Synechococcus sp. PCC 7502]AFY74162.1 hypothetical protein Syn7502_02150 [Synechococcus sp. PCC 7502]
MDALAKKAHFLRRASFGATIEELNSSISISELLNKWLNSRENAPVPNLGVVEKNGKLRRDQTLKFSDWLINQTIYAKNPLQEKVVNFWRDHFVVSAKKVGLPHSLADYDSRLRTYALGDFRELLWSVTTSPAMLSYLDNGQNRSGKINENFSREVMELFTLGRGQYSEKDIQEGARALTGWAIKPNLLSVPEALFLPRRHDQGIKTYLGKTGNLNTEDVVDILANHPSTARTIARKLWSVFAYPNPEPNVVDRLAKVYKQSDRNIKSLVSAIFSSPELYSTKAYRSLLKTPIYFMIGSIRQLEIQADSLKVLGSLKAMGEVFYNAPTVKGFAQGKAWLTAPSLLTRLNLAQQMTQNYGDNGGFNYDPKELTTKDLVALLLDGNTESSIVDALKGLSPRDATALILSSPTYQLA